MTMQVVPIDGAELAVSEHGAGEPVVFVQTALIADELQPVANAVGLVSGYRRIVYHRRGYGRSSPVEGPGSVASDAADCRALLAALHIERAHIVGLSYSGAVGLQLAVDAPECTHTLTLIEPPPVHIPRAAEFRAANDRLLRARRTRGPSAALDELLTMVVGPDWRHAIDKHVPGATGQMDCNSATFFDTDLPALLAWHFGPDDAHTIACPVLHIGGSNSGAWFAEVRDLIRSWLPHAADVVIDGANHSLAFTHGPEVADALVAFMRRHPI